MFDLTGKVALVTGASSGLGRSAAKAYAAYGASVALLARRKELLDELAAELAAQGTDALAVYCDVQDEQSVKDAVAQVIDHFGKIDILLNNAGTGAMGTVVTVPMEDYERTMNTNVRGIVHMCRYVIPDMMKRSYGKIINIASINATMADIDDGVARHAYNISKAAVKGITVATAASYMKHGITVNTIGPGLFHSEMTDRSLFKFDAWMEDFYHMNPAGRHGREGELNGAIIFFSSEASSYVTGQHLLVDGGLDVI